MATHTLPQGPEPTRTRPRHQPLPHWIVPIIVLIVLTLAGLVGWFLWRWINTLNIPDPMQRTTAHLDTVKIAVSVAAAGGAIFALYLAARRQNTQEKELRHSEKVANDNKEDATSRRITELYTKAAEQLGSDKAPVRLAAFYALERLAQDNSEHRQTIVNVLCAYLRMPYLPPQSFPDSPIGDQCYEQLQERQVRLTAQRIITTHLTPKAPAYWPNINLDLTEATLIDFNLNGCHVHNATLTQATLIGTAGFRRVIFTGDVWFDDATFTGDVEFGGSIFTGKSRFDGATFTGNVEFNDAVFTEDAEFSGVAFNKNVEYRNVNFTGKARFSEAVFSGNAGFRRVNFKAAAEFGGVKFAGGSRFGETRFSGDAWFGGARFAKDADFREVTFIEKAGFGSAKFIGDIDFREATFTRDAWFGGARFTGDAELDDVTFAGEAGFRGARFTGDAGFCRVKFAEYAGFIGAVFTGNVDFSGARFSGNVRLRGVTFSGDSIFDETTFEKFVDFSSSIVAHPPSDNTWPIKGWEPSPDHSPIDNRTGTWHQLVQPRFMPDGNRLISDTTLD